MLRRFPILAITSSALLLVSACSLPKIRIPFIGGSTAQADPAVPFNPNSPLGYGHTLHFAVYQGTLSPDRIFSGSGVIDQGGILPIKGIGDIKAGGLTALEAVRKIESAFRVRSGDGIIHVQLEKVEDTRVVTVLGSVRHPAVIQWFTDMTVNSALPYVGGRDLKQPGRAVYIMRNGFSKLHSNPDSGEEISLEPGDVVTFSADL